MSNSIEIIIFLTVPMILGYILDLIIGDPYSFPHPIRFIGILIDKTEKVLRKIFPKNKNSEIIAGLELVVIVCFISFLIPLMLLAIALQINFILALIIETVMCYQILSIKALKDESMKVYYALNKDETVTNEERINKGRRAVSMIVGRDTECLDEEGIVKATVETIAENTSDGTVAPMFFMALGGAPLGFLYKAVNTMDSMVGYKNDKYINFGKCAAKLDDIFNFIPARLAAIFMVVGAMIIKLDYKNAYRIFKRDRFNHASPNSAQTESVCAGALNIQLAGNAYYFGKLYEKKTIGDFIRKIQVEDIILTNKLLYISSLVSLIVFVFVSILLWL